MNARSASRTRSWISGGTAPHGSARHKASVLRDVEGLTAPEVAQVLGVTVDAGVRDPCAPAQSVRHARACVRARIREVAAGTAFAIEASPWPPRSTPPCSLRRAAARSPSWSTARRRERAGDAREAARLNPLAALRFE
jgi:hypothetical protein